MSEKNAVSCGTSIDIEFTAASLYYNSMKCKADRKKYRKIKDKGKKEKIKSKKEYYFRDNTENFEFLWNDCEEEFKNLDIWPHNVDVPFIEKGPFKLIKYNTWNPFINPVNQKLDEIQELADFLLPVKFENEPVC